ncbi:MAG: hypothetical protein EKK59_01760 [Neisseriaceae bacterium]|nr:MAG: hypothetical protein EKK59_01760 [Neisseriaceae bacterium]
MSDYDYDDAGNIIVHRPELLHYHGDLVRMSFVAAAVLMLVMQFTGDNLPMTPVALLGMVTILVIAAGITNPAQRTIHWFNLLISFSGLLIFGSIAISRLDSIRDFFTHDGLAGVISFIFLMAMYLSTRTIRGIMTGANPIASRVHDE